MGGDEDRIATVDAEAETLSFDDVSPEDPRGSEAVLASGDMLGSTYRVIEKLGAGAMGSVWLVEHVELGRQFAAKVVAASKRYDATAIERLKREARTASSIDHDNIVYVTDLGRTERGSIYVVMELLRGEDLRARLERARAGEEPSHLPDDETRDIVRQILAGLEAAHGVDVIHRDLKPENVFLSDKGSRRAVKIVDFGISKIQDPTGDGGITQTGQILGTPLYMAPEQGRSTRLVDARSDLYSVACIAHELVTGEVPFAGETVYDCVVLHASEPPPDPRARRPDLPEAVGAWILRGLAKDPDDRFQDATRMLEAWEGAWEATAGEPATTAEPEVAPLVATERPARRGLWLAAALAAAGLVAAVWWSSSGSGAAPSPEPSPRRAAEAPPRAAGVVPEPPEQATTPEAPVEEPAPAEPVTREIASRPAGAQVIVDGVEVGRTPHAVELPGGEPLELELRRRGYRVERRRLSADDPPTVTVRLRPATPARSPDQVPLAPM